MSKSTTQLAETKDVVSTAISEVLSEGNFDRFDDLYAKGYVNHGGPSGDLTGQGAFQGWMEQVYRGFSDFAATEEFSICEGDLVASRMTYTGTHDGEFMGIPATDTAVEITGNTINRVEDGKIVESWAETDFMSLLQQVGAIDAPGS